MKSPSLRSAGLHRSLTLTAAACLTLTVACHNPRFQSDDSDAEELPATKLDASACDRGTCEALTTHPGSEPSEDLITGPPATPEDAANTQPDEDAALTVSPEGGNASSPTTDLATTNATESSTPATESSTSALESSTTTSNEATSGLSTDSSLLTSLDEPSSTTSSPAVDASVSTKERDAGTTPVDSSTTIQLDASSSDASEDANAEEAGLSDAHADAATDASVEANFDASEGGPRLNCEATTVLPGTVRDFDEAHPDMEPCEDEGVDCSSERGLIATDLGDDDKPVFSTEERDEDSTIQSQESFDQWFRDVEDVNLAIPFDLRLTTRPRMLVFDSDNPPDDSPEGFSTDPEGFFPIDDWNTSEHPHNYHFTYEVQSYIAFEPGDTLTIRGDDDIFVFVNRQLVIDLGGIHLPQEATIEFDEVAEQLGLEPDVPYEFHLFFAERHVEQSNLRLSTSGQFYACVPE